MWTSWFLATRVRPMLSRLITWLTIPKGSNSILAPVVRWTRLHSNSTALMTGAMVMILKLKIKFVPVDQMCILLFAFCTMQRLCSTGQHGCNERFSCTQDLVLPEVKTFYLACYLHTRVSRIQFLQQQDATFFKETRHCIATTFPECLPQQVPPT